jgi:hypothetical protein
MQRNIRYRWFLVFAVAAPMACAWNASSAMKSGAPDFQTSDRCVACHNGMSTRAGEDISIGLAWQPTMMANSAKDPYWHAGVRRETLDHPGKQASIEDECAICHMPMARFESKKGGREETVFSHLRFLPTDDGDRLAADGVSCSFCHQIGAENLGTRKSFVGAFVIGGPLPTGERLEFGPYAPDAGHTRIMRSSTGGVVPKESVHMRQSEICATCHTLLTRALTSAGESAVEFPEQVPYQEWLHSDYKNSRSCQSCHMPVVQESVPITSVLGVPREGVSRHFFVGGNFFMQGILNRNRRELTVTSAPDGQSEAIERTKAHLTSDAARVSIGSVTLHNRRLETEIAVENLGGHKLPTAYPSRRVWLHLVVRDSQNRTVFESGAVNAAGAIVGNDNDSDAARFEPHYAEIRNADQVQIYEAIMADTNGAVTTGLLHAVRYVKDNRLLPRGFDKRTAASDIAVAGAAAEDADFSGGADRVRYSIDLGQASGTLAVEAELCYQPIGHRWAANLKQYDAEEPRRFVRYYEAAVASSTVVLARAQAQFKPSAE